MLKRAIIILVSIGLFVSADFLPVYAATATNPTDSGQALEIAPPVISLTVNPGQITTIPIYLRDISKTRLIVTGEANDFIAAGEDGTPKILLDPTEVSPYSMKNWVKNLPSLNLIPREVKAMTITLAVPQDASPGGHYGVIRFTATPPDLNDTGVSLSASLGALLLITVSGKITENVSVQQFAASKDGHVSSFFESAPFDLVEVFKNNGNIHEQPTGQIIVKDMFGRTFTGVNVNAPPRNVLPGSSRKFTQALDSHAIGTAMMFGRYTADMKITYGSARTVITSTISFWVIPYKIIAAVAIGGVLAFFVLRFVIRRYNRHIITQSQRSRRR